MSNADIMDVCDYYKTYKYDEWVNTYQGITSHLNNKTLDESGQKPKYHIPKTRIDLQYWDS